MIVALPRVLNKYAKSKEENTNSTDNTTIYNNESYSVITEEIINKEVNKENTDIIDMFIKYCNDKEPEKSYELLSNKCKEKLYPTLDDFINSYYTKIFNNQKSYEIKLWISKENSYTYKVNLKENILSTGNVNASTIEDYYTIVNENNMYKLNINNYIGNIKINKQNETNELGILVSDKDIFMEYEIYNINVEIHFNFSSITQPFFL